jgi:signal transduction histidine kinase
MLNLLLNARDAMSGGGVVEVALVRQGDRARVTVRDHGPGIDPEAARHLFEPFWTSKEKGGGLGLALSRGIIEEMGGTLDLQGHSAGDGACATIELPLQKG